MTLGEILILNKAPNNPKDTLDKIQIIRRIYAWFSTILFIDI
jgi:hypothetical protein